MSDDYERFIGRMWNGNVVAYYKTLSQHSSAETETMKNLPGQLPSGLKYRTYDLQSMMHK
jgi:hypothetical protein